VLALLAAFSVAIQLWVSLYRHW